MSVILRKWPPPVSPSGAIDTYCPGNDWLCEQFEPRERCTLFLPSLSFLTAFFLSKSVSSFRGKRNKSKRAGTIWYALSFLVLPNPALSLVCDGARTGWMNGDLCWCLCCECWEGTGWGRVRGRAAKEAASMGAPRDWPCPSPVWLSCPNSVETDISIGLKSRHDSQVESLCD